MCMYAESILPSPRFLAACGFFSLAKSIFVYCMNWNGQEHVATNAYLSLGADQQVHTNIFASPYLWNIPYTHLTTLNLPNEDLKFYSCKLMFYLSGIEIS